MPSNHSGESTRRNLALACSLAAIGFAMAASPRLGAQQLGSSQRGVSATQSSDGNSLGRRFFADDPVWHDADMRDIPPVAPFDLSKSYEFLNETFGETVQSRGPSLNVNTLGEVPDSSWFTNRLGTRDMTIEQVVRGPN